MGVIRITIWSLDENMYIFPSKHVFILQYFTWEYKILISDLTAALDETIPWLHNCREGCKGFYTNNIFNRPFLKCVFSSQFYYVA
jgi:hypothetical protein